MKKHVMVAAAWPYANGSLHLGHVAGLMSADIMARYYRLQGNQVMFVSGADCHGTPIEVAAEKERVAPKQIAEKYHREFTETLVKKLGFSYDTFTTTMTKNHQTVVQELFLDLHKKGHIYTKTESYPYCETDHRFLPDRYVEGVCPLCGFENARGDQCDNCGNLLDPGQLKKPRCKICGHTPIWKDSEHFYLRLSAFSDQLKKWVDDAKGWRKNAKNFTEEFIAGGLKDRAITRDSKWGIPIPLPGFEGKTIYVWFEAVTGYLSASIEISKRQGKPELWKDFWQGQDDYHIYVHGKDNIPFHTVIWPVMLMGKGGLHLPDMIVSSEYLTLEHRQFSKSRQHAVWLPDFLNKFNADTLRYFLVANGPETSDADFSWDEYMHKTNGELAATYGNLVNRVLTMIQRNFSDGAAADSNDPATATLLKQAEETFTPVGTAIEEARFRDGLRAIMKLAEAANKFLQETKPWETVKTNPTKAQGHLGAVAHVVACLGILFAPYLPASSKQLSGFMTPFPKLSWKYPNPTRYTPTAFTALIPAVDKDLIAKEKEVLAHLPK